MKGSINLDFKDEDLRKFVADAARRWTLNTIQDVIRHVLNDPSVSQVFMEGVRTVIAGYRSASSGSYTQNDVRQRRASQHQRGAGFDVGEFFSGWPPHQRPNETSPPPPPGDVRQGDKLKRCMPVEANLYQEEGWGCHECSTYNSVHRSVCRQCGHERCDDAAPSPPSPEGNVPSGSA